MDLGCNGRKEIGRDLRVDRSITKCRGEEAYRWKFARQVGGARTSGGEGGSIIKSSPKRRANFDPHEFSASTGGGELCSPGGKNKMSGADGVKLSRNLEQPEIPASRHQLHSGNWSGKNFPPRFPDHVP